MFFKNVNLAGWGVFKQKKVGPPPPPPH